MPLRRGDLQRFPKLEASLVYELQTHLLLVIRQAGFASPPHTRGQRGVQDSFSPCLTSQAWGLGIFCIHGVIKRQTWQSLWDGRERERERDIYALCWFAHTSWSDSTVATHFQGRHSVAFFQIKEFVRGGILRGIEVRLDIGEVHQSTLFPLSTA